MYYGRYRRSRKLLRLFAGVLIFTKTITPAPSYIVFYQFTFKIRRVYIQCEFLPAYSTRSPCITVRNPEPASFIVYKAIK